MPAKVFLSHSRKKTDAEEATFKALLERLRATGFAPYPNEGIAGQILIDEHLRPGDLWRRRIFSWLFEADCGIVFCTKLNKYDDSHIAEMRNWLYTEATALALRRHAGFLGKFLVVTCNHVRFRTHPLAALEALQLSEFQHIEISGPHDGAGLQRIADEVGMLAGADQIGSQPCTTKFEEDRERLTQWLQALDKADPARHVPSRLVRMRALKALRVDFLSWTSGAAQAVSREQDRALALRLIEGPSAPPPDFPNGPTIRPYGDEHVAQWSELLKLTPAPAIDQDLTEVVGNSWVGIEMASQLGYVIQSGKRVLHVRIEITGGPDEPDLAANKNAQRDLLAGLLAAGGWIWTTGDTQVANVEHVARQFRKRGGKIASAGSLIAVNSTVSNQSELVHLVKDKRKPRLGRHSVVENPIVVVDASGLFLDHVGDPDHVAVAEFMANWRSPTSSLRMPSVFLFVVSSGSLLSGQAPSDWAEFEVVTDAWQAAFGLRDANNAYFLELN